MCREEEIHTLQHNGGGKVLSKTGHREVNLQNVRWSLDLSLYCRINSTLDDVCGHGKPR